MSLVPLNLGFDYGGNHPYDRVEIHGDGITLIVPKEFEDDVRRVCWKSDPTIHTMNETVRQSFWVWEGKVVDSARVYILGVDR